MSDSLPPLDETIRDLLSLERQAAAAPPGAKARVREGIEAALVFTPSGGGGGHGHRLAGAISTARAVSLATAFVVGGVSGAAVLHAMTAAPTAQEKIVYVDRVVSASPSAALTSAPAPTPAPQVPASSSTAPVEPITQPDGQLSQERAILDVARIALARDDGDATLAALSKHEKRFPSGQLTEEREALAIRGLVLLKRNDEALARGERFRKRFPNSVLAPAIEATLGTIP